MTDTHFNPIAIVAMGGVFPGAESLDRFWANITDKVSAISPVPAHRWVAASADMLDHRGGPDKAWSDRAGLIDQIEFDPAGFGIDAALIESLDPLYHLLLHAGRQTVEPDSLGNLDRQRVGVILAAIALPTDSASRLAQRLLGAAYNRQVLTPLVSEGPPGELLAARDGAAARVTSYPAACLAAALGLGGPSFTLDAACASSIYAIKLACDMLNSGRVDAMLCGGISRPDALYTQVGFTQLQALSPTGHCAPFDARADGLVVGEGAGLLLLKRLDDARQGRDRIHAVIRGIGLSNDLRGNLLAPDSEGQLRAMQAAYRQCGWRPSDVDLIECHGAGTALGDRTELVSLNRLWDNERSQRAGCAIGSVKSMIGHLLTAAAAASTIKTVLALSHHTLPPSLNFQSASADSPLHDSPFRVQTESAPWPLRPGAKTRCAAVNAFGFGGINAHLLLEEYQPPSEPAAQAAQFSNATVDVSAPTSSPADPDLIAIVGLDAAVGPLETLDQVKQAVFEGPSPVADRPAGRWRGIETSADTAWLNKELRGAFISSLAFEPGEFRIPPNELDDIIAQHLLMLRVARRAAQMAALKFGVEHPRVGTVIGIDFDFEATDFCLRWAVHNKVRSWQRTYDFNLDENTLGTWIEGIADAISPPLTRSRTLGALGSMVASRVARELRLGGPSFVVSAEAASGLNALQVAVASLRQSETDTMIVGAVDLCGDVRAVANAALRAASISGGSTVAPQPNVYHKPPAEGAAAVVLKRLADAQAQGDTIYAVLKGVVSATAQDASAEAIAAAYQNSLKEVLQAASITLESVILYDPSGGVAPDQDDPDRQVLARLPASTPCHVIQPSVLASTSAALGQAGATMDMLALVKTVCCLYHRTLPAELAAPAHQGPHAAPDPFWSLTATTCVVPSDAKHALVAAVSADGQVAHAVLSAHHTRPWQRAGQKSRSDEASRTDSKKRGALIKTMGGAPLFPPPPTALRAVINDSTPSKPKPPENEHPPLRQLQQLLQNTADTISETTLLHERYLNLSADLIHTYADGLKIRDQILARMQSQGTQFSPPLSPTHEPQKALSGTSTTGTEPLFSRQMCLEFATGAVARVLGPDFSPVDAYAARVRLPDEPLMLVDRILSIEGERRSLQSGRIVTEHDVLPDAWYLDSGQVPVCIAVEAGQADLFLSAYLGIDFQVKGERTYRLLDATVTFHRRLPQPGDTIRYDIKIEKFVRQRDTYLFFFSFTGTIDGGPLITMTDGCAGFFTPREVESSGGIVLTSEERAPAHGRAEGHWEPLVPCRSPEAYDENQVDALRRGDLSACFGDDFADIQMAHALRLPGGRMRLIDRILELDPGGGRYGLGRIRAEADIHPDDWFLVCHFVDDMVMPGTLMYECCAHALRVLLQRMGWISDRPEARYQPVVDVASILKCRGPVTPTTGKVVYEIQVRKIAYHPEPFVIGDAYMFADGHRIVAFEDISMRFSGVDLEALRSFWESQTAAAPSSSPFGKPPVTHRAKPVFDRSRLIEFSQGSPSLAFGEPYRPFDGERFIARLPREPFLMIDRIVRAEPPPWTLKPGGWATAETDIDQADWFLRAEGTGLIPYSILLEMALQPCGWLAAYMGSALRSEKALYFRNLGGTAKLAGNVDTTHPKLTTRCRLTRISDAADMIIETFQFQVLQNERRVFHGDTYFGFFTAPALQQQTGIRDAAVTDLALPVNDAGGVLTTTLKAREPLTPHDTGTLSTAGRATLPAGALLMIDRIERCQTDGGPHGLGFVHATKQIRPEEWFFKAHFLDDPVWPGSLGIEAFIQSMKYYMLSYGDDFDNKTFNIIKNEPHHWTYRGQVLPSNTQVEVVAVITQRLQSPRPTIMADGWLSVDGKLIYEMKNYGLCLAHPADER